MSVRAIWLLGSAYTPARKTEFIGGLDAVEAHGTFPDRRKQEATIENAS